MDLRGTFNQMDTIAFIFLLPYERVCSIIRSEYQHIDNYILAKLMDAL